MRTNGGQDDKNYIEVTAKIFCVLEYFVQEGGCRHTISIQELSKVLPFANTTMHRILYSLEKLGYLEKASRAYHLGTKFHALIGSAVQLRGLQKVAREVMLDLLVRHSETVSLGFIDRGEVAYLEVVQSPSVLRISASPNDRTPIHSTSLGKVILAYLPEAEARALLKVHPLIQITSKTITRENQFLKELALVRERGIAFDLGENVDGAVSVAAPVFDHHIGVIAGLSILGPSVRMKSKLLDIGCDLRRAGLKVSRLLRPFPGGPAGTTELQFSRCCSIRKGLVGSLVPNRSHE